MARRSRSASGPLGARAQAILRAVIEEYVVSATPVGSAALVERYRLGLSPATVRGVLADLEAAGLLTHPHTSAGRIPTDRGYRFYVESLADSTTLPAVEQLMIRHQFGQVQFATDHWFRLAATTLASMTGSAGLATAAKPAAARLRWLDLVAQNHLASFILVPREGTIKQGQLSLHRPVGQSELSRVANRLNAELADLTAAAIEARVPAYFAESARPGLDHDGPQAREAALVARVAERIARTLRESDAASIEEVYSDGLLNVMEAPEFAQSEKLRRVFSALENRAYLADLLGTMSGSGRIHVFIGHENSPAEMRDVSLVLASYGRPGRAVGVVGVLGPTRMAYSHAMGTVGFVSGLMNELVDHMYS
ncbi:MAG: heat-inducible transcriptional repressor [Chloroflexota bacterium]|nr:heat-inducible transcriptional repressor [Chloroflexota bacterium]